MLRTFFRVAVLSVATFGSATAFAKPPVVQAVQVGDESVRYLQGVPTLDLRKAKGAVQITPLAMDHGSLAFSVAVLNAGDTPANIDVTNFAATSAGQAVGVFTVLQLVSKAQNRAMWGQIGLALAGGISAAAAASQRDTYSSTLSTPRGFYRSTFSAPSSYGQVQAMAISAGTGIGIAAIQNRLDETRAELGNEVVQLSTVDPDRSYAGRIVLHKIKTKSLPHRVDLVVTWNGEEYPFAFQLAKEGTPSPQFVTRPVEVKAETIEPAAVLKEASPAFSEIAVPDLQAVPNNASVPDKLIQQE